MFKREKTRTTRTPPAPSSPEASTIVRTHLDRLPEGSIPPSGGQPNSLCMKDFAPSRGVTPRAVAGSAPEESIDTDPKPHPLRHPQPARCSRTHSEPGSSRSPEQQQSFRVRSPGRPREESTDTDLECRSPATTPTPATRSTRASRTPSGRSSASRVASTTRRASRTTGGPGDSRSRRRSTSAAPSSTLVAGDRAT